MQTFLPYPDFSASAASLHPKHLGKQRLEVAQLLDALHDLDNEHGGWAPRSVWNHPVTEMWRGYEPQLATYGLIICAEWIERGYNSNGSCENKILHHLTAASSGEDTQMLYPPWFGDVRFHEMHRSVLIRKMPAHYGPLFPETPPDIEAYYPSRV